MNIPDLIINDKSLVTLDEVFLNENNKHAIIQLIKEHHYIDTLLSYGLPASNKILLHGASGCGKTMTAKAIAHTLKKNILILNLSNVICARIGETSQHIRMVFDKAAREKAVLFLDEFDQVGKARGNDDKDVGEMRRLVNTLIQLIDYFPDNALLICATNHAHIVDTALLRRFQLSIGFEMPGRQELDTYYDHLLSQFPVHLQDIRREYGMSFAGAKDHALICVKTKLISELENKLPLFNSAGRPHPPSSAS